MFSPPLQTDVCISILSSHNKVISDTNLSMIFSCSVSSFSMQVHSRLFTKKKGLFFPESVLPKANFPPVQI